MFHRGREKLESCLLLSRLKTSLTVCPSKSPPSLSAPKVSSLDHVNEYVKSKPCENRLVTLVWSASYQVFPNGPALLNGPNWGKGVNARWTVKFLGKPAKGTWSRKRPAPACPIWAPRMVRSAGLWMSSPYCCSRRSGMSELYAFNEELRHQLPRLAT